MNKIHKKKVNQVHKRKSNELQKDKTNQSNVTVPGTKEEWKEYKRERWKNI